MASNSFGFASLPIDNTSRSAYIEQLPVIAECLTQKQFEDELEYVIISISRTEQLLQKLFSVSKEIVAALDKERALSFIYFVGSRVMTLFNSGIKKECADVYEVILQEINDVPMELEKFIKPIVENKELEMKKMAKFSVWRLSRLTSLVPENDEIKLLVYNAFTNQESLVYNAELLPFLSKEECQKYIVNAFLLPVAEVKASAVDAISYYKFDNSEELINTYLMSENSLVVLKRALNMPPELLPVQFLTRLLKHPDLGTEAVKVALKSQHLNELIPILISTHIGVCELNDLSPEVITNTKPTPYDLISYLLRESTELVSDDIIKAIASLDESNVLFRIIFPRMGEKESWRSRYIAVQIMKEIISNKKDGNYGHDHAGFIIAMILDTSYAVRHLVLETLKIFPDIEIKKFIIKSLLSLAMPHAQPFHLSVIKMVIDEAPELLVGFEDEMKEVEKYLDLN